MIQAKCIQKFRDKSNKIYGYRLQDNQDNTKDVTPQQLKQAIRNNQINITNLKLTSDNRLLNTTPTQQPDQKPNPAQQQFSLLTRKIVEQINKPKALKFKSNQNLDALEPKAKLLGYETTKLSDDFLLIENNTEIVLVSNKQIQLDDTKEFYGALIGLFQYTEFKSIDFHNVDTSNVTNMYAMFYSCKAQTLDLSSLDTSNVTDMESMFSNCQAQKLDLSSFDTSNVTDTEFMFYNCQAKTIDLSSFNTSNVTDMGGMFYKCQVQTLDLSSFNTSNVKDMGYMFGGCEAQTLDLSSFDTSNVENMENMFLRCQAQIKTTDTKLLKRCKTGKSINKGDKYMSLIKVDKRTASKEYIKGTTIHLLPSKAAPGSIWITPTSINKQCGKSFDELINEYTYYNCNKETGLRVNYYIDK